MSAKRTGVGAQGFELHGSFDWSTLSAVGTTGMDYCGTPSVAGVATRRADHNRDAHERRNSSHNDDAGSSGITPRTAPTFAVAARGV